MPQNWSRLSSNVLRNRPASGIRTITDSHVSVSPMVRPNPGKLLRRTAIALKKPSASLSWLSRRFFLARLLDANRYDFAAKRLFRSILVNLIEDAALAEMFLLRLGPTAEDVIDREQLHLGEGFFVFLRNLLITRTIGIACGNFLTLSRIPVFQVGLGHRARTLSVGHGIDDRDRRFSQDRQWRRDDLELVLAELALRQERLVFPGQQYVADAALDEGHGRAARARIQHRNMLVELGDELPRLVGRAQLLLGVAPGGKVVPARAARGLRVRRDHVDTRLDQVVPILDALRVALAHQEHDGRGIG